MRDIVVPFGDHYPETLGIAIVQDLPWYVRLFVTIIWPFVDNRTRRTVRFLRTEDIPRQPEISEEQLLSECGGQLEVSTQT